MKINLSISAFFVFMFAAFNTSAQNDTRIIREVACSVNDGYAMSDVVEFARNINWSDTAPDGVFFREAYAVSGEFQDDWDFIIGGMFENFQDMAANVRAQRSRAGGREGEGFADMITCSARPRVSLIIRANDVGDLFEDSETTAMAVMGCRLNDGTVADAFARAAQIGQNLEAYAAVSNRIFGGPVQESPSVGIRMVFPSGEFGPSMDSLIAAGPPNQPNDGLECRGGSLWLVHRIHSAN
tara:strand:+ start:601 stop:1320 length:720 start_codon:yes stop_codon:yes gene_type:complete